MNNREWSHPVVRRAAAAVFAVLVAAAPGRAQHPEVPTVTLDEAVERALEASPVMEQSRGAIQNATWGERTAWGAFLPSVSLSSGTALSSQERFNPQTNTTVTGSSDSYRAGVSASIDLFTGGRRGAEIEQARAQTAQAEASLVESRFTVALQAKRAFFDVLRANDLIRVAETRLGRAEEGLEAAERRLEVGSATRSDVLRAELELNQARQALLQAEAQRRTATFALGRTVGADGPVGAELEAPLTVEAIDLSRDEHMRLVETSAPTVQAALAQTRSAEAGVSAAKTQYFPSLRLSAGSDWYNQNPAWVDGRSSWGLSVGLSLPVFNGFQREAQVQQAAVQARVADARLADARRQAGAEAARLLAAVELAREQLELAEEAVRVAEEDLRVQEERYRLGASTMLDRIASQTQLVEAEQGLVAARYDYQIARAELEALAGREL